MRILYLAQFFNRPDEAGAGRHYAFATEWARLGHDVTVVTGRQNYRTGRATAAGWRATTETVDGVRVIRTYVYTAYQGSFKKRYLNFLSFFASGVWAGLRASKPDVVFASSPPLTVALAGQLLSRLRRVPLVADIRDLWPESAVALGVVGEGRFVRLASRLAQGVYRHASRVVAVTGGIESGLLAQGVPRDRIVKVTNGVDVGLYDEPPAPSTLRKELGLEDRFLCVYVGGMGILHDVGTLVDAARATTDPNVHFLLVGQGDDRTRLEGIVAAEGLANVTFHDPLPKKAVPGVLASADCCVYSLRDAPFFRGTFPNKNFDYLAAARPVVLAVEGESADLVHDSGAGLVARPGDGADVAAKIANLSALSDAERSAMGAKGRTYVLSRYRRQDLAGELEAVLASIVGVRTRRPSGGRRERGVA